MKKQVTALCCAVLFVFAVAAQTKSLERSYSLQNGVQTVIINLKPRSYDAITVKKGIPVRFVLKADTCSINGCNNEVVISRFKIAKKLQVGDNIIEFTPAQAGVIPCNCWMNMIRSKITVID